MGKQGSFDIILQGGGQMAIVFDDDRMRPEEIGAFKVLLEEQRRLGLPVSVMAGLRTIYDNRPLNEQNLTKITARDRSSGKYHTRYIEVMEDGSERTLVDERCQADQSGRYDVVQELPESLDRNVLCYYCYPPVEVEREHTAGPI